MVWLEIRYLHTVEPYLHWGLFFKCLVWLEILLLQISSNTCARDLKLGKYLRRVNWNNFLKLELWPWTSSLTIFPLKLVTFLSKSSRVVLSFTRNAYFSCRFVSVAKSMCRSLVTSWSQTVHTCWLHEAGPTGFKASLTVTYDRMIT